MAVRIVGVDLPQNKRGDIALTYIFGIGRSAAKSILDKAAIDPSIKVKDWSDDQAAKVREVIGADYKVEGDLRSEIQLNIKRLHIRRRTSRHNDSPLANRYIYLYCNWDVRLHNTDSPMCQDRARWLTWSHYTHGR